MAEPPQLYVISGVVFDSDGSTLLSDINVQVTNTTTGESHNSTEDDFLDLETNAQGEWQTNLAKFTSFSNGDSLSITALGGIKGNDTETTTVVLANGGESNIDLVLVTDEVQLINDTINTLGERATHRTFATTYDTSLRGARGTILTETPTDATITMYHEPVEDEEVLMEWGEVKQGEALMVFKSKNEPNKGDLIRVPTTGDFWRVQNKPIRYRKGGITFSFEARGVRIDSS